MIEYLDWDSRFFKIKIGKTATKELTELQLNEIYSQKSNCGYDLVYLFCKNVHPEIEASIFKNNGALVDLKVTYSRIINKKQIIALPEIETYKGPLSSELLNLVLASGHKSRFKKDPILTRNFEKLYTQWIKNYMDGNLAKSILVHKTDNSITGFVTLDSFNGIGKIGLIAVDENTRGKGIGRQLLQAAENWYISNNIEQCKVVTQLDNVEACKLYEKFNYSIESIDRIYHI